MEEENLIPKAPVFRKKIPDYEIYTKTYKSKIVSLKAIENFIIISSLTKRGELFFEIIDAEEQKIIFSHELRVFYSDDDKIKVIDLFNGFFIYQHDATYAHLVDLNKKEIKITFEVSFSCPMEI